MTDLVRPGADSSLQLGSPVSRKSSVSRQRENLASDMQTRHCPALNAFRGDRVRLGGGLRARIVRFQLLR